jgi:hypothetical protein
MPKGKYLTIMFILSICACPALAYEASEELTQENSPPESSIQEEGTSIELTHYATSRTGKLKTGDIRILGSLQELKNFYVELGVWEYEKGTKFVESIDFSHEQIVLVVSQPLDSCKRAGVKSVKRFQGDYLEVTLETFWRKSCQPKPNYPENLRYQVFELPIERPVAKVDVVYTSRADEYP